MFEEDSAAESLSAALFAGLSGVLDFAGEFEESPLGRAVVGCFPLALALLTILRMNR